MQEFYGALGMIADPVERRSARPGQMVASVLQIGRPALGHWTGIGILIFGTGGQLVMAELDSLDRAIERRDAVDFSRISADELDITSLRRLVHREVGKIKTYAELLALVGCPLQVPYGCCQAITLRATDPEPLGLDELDLTDWIWRDFIERADVGA